MPNEMGDQLIRKLQFLFSEQMGIWYPTLADVLASNESNEPSDKSGLISNVAMILYLTMKLMKMILNAVDIHSFFWALFLHAYTYNGLHFIGD